MSIRVMTAVWDQADVSGGELLVLLAMADWASDDGGRCFPTQARLAKKARMTDRGVRKCIASLVEKGYLRREGRLGGGPVEWSIHPRPEQSSDRNPSSGQTGTPVPTEPLGEPSVEDSLRSSSTSAREEKRAEKLKQANGVVALCDRLAELMRQRDPKAKVAPNSISWLTAAEALMRIDERHFEEAMEVLEFSQADPFWQTVILSMPKFRAKYDPLRAKWVNSKVRNAAAAQPQASVADLVSAYERPRSRTGIA